MNAEILFGEWRPDVPLASLGNVTTQGAGNIYGPQAVSLVTASNVMPGPNGYRPVQAVSPITSALAGFNGGGAYVGSNATAALLVGTASGLSRYAGTWSSVYAGSTPGRWQFAQFGDNVIAVDGGAPVSFSLTAGTAALLGGSPPAAGMVTTVRDFVVLAGDPDNILTLTWSGFNDSA